MNFGSRGNSAAANESGFDLATLVMFFSLQWKKLLLGAAAGLLVGLLGWFVLSSYKAETVLINNRVGFLIKNKLGSEKEEKQEIRAVNFISWRNLQKNLPILAAQFSDKATGDDKTQLKLMEKPSWWQKNVVPTYSLSKAETKELAGISKELQDAEGQTILNFTVTAQGTSKEKALANLGVVTNFIRSGSCYLLLKNLINEYDSQVAFNDSELQKRITDAEVELTFLRERAKNLEALRQRFPSNVAVANQQVMDLKDSNAKFMPISTQLVAVNADINNTVESLIRMRDKLNQMRLLHRFVTEATPLTLQESNGLKLADQLLTLESSLRAQVGPEDVNAQQSLNTIQADIVLILARSTKGLEESANAYASRSEPILPAVSGSLGGVLVMLVMALLQGAMARLKP